MLKYIIIVDDEVQITDLFVEALKANDYESVGFYNAEDALEYIMQTGNRIGLVLTDIGLPKMSGIEFSRELYQLKPDIPVVVFSGAYLDEADTSETHIVRVLNKPVKVQDIIQVLKEHS